MRTVGTDAVGVLGWGMRRYRGLFLACFLVGGLLVPYLVVTNETPTESSALVIAQRLDMDLEALPRYAEAVFTNGEVARAVATEFPEVGEEDVVPERAAVLAEQDSLVLTVTGRDPDPRIAADIANVAANAYVQALNTAGAGVGLFVLQSEAQPSSAGGGGRLGTVVAIALGLIAGLMLALAAVSVMLVARRPVIDPADATQLTGIPVLGIVGVPRTPRGTHARPEAFTGIVPVCRRLMALPTSTVVIVGSPRERSLRAELSVAMATVLMRVRDVRFVGTAASESVVADRRSAMPVTTDEAGMGRLHISLVDSSEPLDLVQPPQDTATVLVASVGIRSTALRDAVLEHLGGAAEARILLVKRTRRPRGSSTVPTASASDGTKGEPAVAARQG